MRKLSLKNLISFGHKKSKDTIETGPHNKPFVVNKSSDSKSKKYDLKVSRKRKNSSSQFNKDHKKRTKKKRKVDTNEIKQSTSHKESGAFTKSSISKAEDLHAPKREQPSFELSEEITKLAVNDYTNYVLSVKSSDTPLINVSDSRDNMKINIIESLKSQMDSEKDKSDKEIINNLMKRSAHDKKNILNQVVNSIMNDNYTKFLDPDFRRSPFIQNLSIIENVLNRKKYDRDLMKNNFTNYNIPELGVSYISREMREVNPENRYEHYCLNSHMKRKSMGVSDTSVNNGMVPNNCYGHKTFGITLKSIVFPLEKTDSAPQRKCVVCLFQEYTDLFIETNMLNTVTKVFIQEFSVRIDQPDGYKSVNTIPQGEIPLIKAPMKFHEKSHYVVNGKKLRTTSGKWLKGLDEKSSIHFH